MVCIYHLIDKIKMICKKEQSIEFLESKFHYFSVYLAKNSPHWYLNSKLFSLLDQPWEHCQLSEEGVLL